MSQLSIILPVHNEGENLLSTLKEIHDSLSHLVDFQFILSEDGSRDNTVEVIEQAAHLYPMKYITSKGRKGYAKAVIDAIDLATSTYILFLDSDGQLDPRDFLKFWDDRDNYDVNVGNRKKRLDPIIRIIYSRMFFAFYQILFHTPLNDPSCPFVLVRTKTAQTISKDWKSLGDRWSEGFWWEFNAWASKRGFSFCEHTINHRLRADGSGTQVYKLEKMPGIIIRNVKNILSVRTHSLR